MLKITGLWKNVSKNGKVYLSGSFGSARVLIFENTNKTKDNQPDYEMLLAERGQREERSEDDMPLNDEF